ncbi:MAG: GNAT family N-acetyltransferase [Desulfobacterales bacterium]|nr:GNAT family N-acetyltransferase [Desulfobacterales bacterium]
MFSAPVSSPEEKRRLEAERMDIIEVNHARTWNRFVTGNAHACYTHLYEWRELIENVYGHKSLYLSAVKENKICGLLPLYCIKRPLSTPYWVSMPFFDHAGVLGEADAGKQLIKKAESLLCSHKGGNLSLRQNNRFNPGDLPLGRGRPDVFNEKVSLQIPLASSPQLMMAGFRSKLRNQINKGVKNGLTWEIGKKRLLDSFYHVFSRNMRDLGSPVHSKAFFRAVFNFFPDNAFICVVYYKRTPVAASFMFRFKKALANPWASSLRAYRHLNSNMLLYWQMIRFACTLGLDFFDMGRSSKGASTYRFKQQWSPRETPLNWFTWEWGDKRVPRETLVIQPWKKMPVRIANIAGPMIRKYISL